MGTVHANASKSAMQRACAAALVAKGITFIHNPPLEKWNKNKFQQRIISETLINDNYQFNENLFLKLEKQMWKENIVFFYTLSNYHKKYIYNKYPQYKNKLVSIHHPIDLNCKKEELFNYNKFLKNKNIFNIGWWLRNFISFNNFIIPNKYKKIILFKSDFKNIWETKFQKVIFNDVKFMDELDNEDYIKIFSNSCVFLDIVDGITNNIVLECIKYNTPIFVRRIPSLVEYLGSEYPLFFNNINELNELSKIEDKFLKLILNANEYLRNMNKNHISLDVFNKKLNYDLSKLENNENTNIVRLTWIAKIDDLNLNNLCNINNFIKNFSSQSVNSQLNLIIMIDEKINDIEKINKNNGYNNIEIIKYTKSFYTEDLNTYIKDIKSDYIIKIEITDNYDIHFSNNIIKYLDNNPTCDLAISTHNKKRGDIITQLLIKNELFFKDDILNIKNNIGRIIWRTKIAIQLEIKLDKNFIDSCLKNNLNIISGSSKPLYTILD